MRSRRSRRAGKKERGKISSTRDTPMEKLEQLQRMVPGGQAADTETLFQRTSNYISFLETYISLLKSISTAYGVPKDH